mmetsp:Transcript_21448/g.45028  ORF Transcript_21448/g.45028 Transcript_21448/m.45028 type:complete len:613 (-) Transcript_21448:42-1880(-)
MLSQFLGQFLPVEIVPPSLPLGFQHVPPLPFAEQDVPHGVQISFVGIGAESVETGKRRSQQGHHRRFLSVVVREKSLQHPRTSQFLLHLLASRQMISQRRTFGGATSFQSLSRQPFDSRGVVVGGGVVPRGIIGGGVPRSEVDHGDFSLDDVPFARCFHIFHLVVLVLVVVLAVVSEKETSVRFVETHPTIHLRQRQPDHPDSVIFPQSKFQQTLIHRIGFSGLDHEENDGSDGRGALVGRGREIPPTISLVSEGHGGGKAGHGGTSGDSPLPAIAVVLAIVLSRRRPRDGRFVLLQKGVQRPLVSQPLGQKPVEIGHPFRETGEGRGDGVQFHLFQFVSPARRGRRGRAMQHVIAAMNPQSIGRLGEFPPFFLGSSRINPLVQLRQLAGEGIHLPRAAQRRFQKLAVATDPVDEEVERPGEGDGPVEEGGGVGLREEGDGGDDVGGGGRGRGVFDGDLEAVGGSVGDGVGDEGAEGGGGEVGDGHFPVRRESGCGRGRAHGVVGLGGRGERGAVAAAAAAGDATVSSRGERSKGGSQDRGPRENRNRCHCYCCRCRCKKEKERGIATMRLAEDHGEKMLLERCVMGDSYHYFICAFRAAWEGMEVRQEHNN